MSTVANHISLKDGDNDIAIQNVIETVQDIRASLDPNHASLENLANAMNDGIERLTGTQTGFIASYGSDNELSFGVQRETENTRVGVSADSEGDIQLSSQFYNSVNFKDNYTFTSSGELTLSSDSNENVIQVTGEVAWQNPDPVRGEWALQDYSVGAGAAAYGSQPEIIMAVQFGGEVSNGVTSVFGAAAIQGSEYEATVGVNQELLHGTVWGDIGVEGTVTFTDHDNPNPSVGFTLEKHF